jgi:uncharacterized damage-inducible protein DinB
MMLEEILDSWKEVRAGLVEEAEQIPAERFAFRPADESRSVAAIIQHIIEAQRFLVGEVCRPDTNFKRAPIMDLIKSYAGDIQSIEEKEALIEVLKTSMQSAEATIRAFGEEPLTEIVERLDGRNMSKLSFLQFTINHEMYHRGQITVYERVMQIEPVLTFKLKQFLAANQ